MFSLFPVLHTNNSKSESEILYKSPGGNLGITVALTQRNIENYMA